MLSFSVRGWVSIKDLARICTIPRPVVYASFIPFRPCMKPAVGKSGPFIIPLSSSIVTSGLSIYIIQPSIISPRLCGGMFVAMPTAIPDEPFIRRFGILVGRTIGSTMEPS